MPHLFSLLSEPSGRVCNTIRHALELFDVQTTDGCCCRSERMHIDEACASRCRARPAGGLKRVQRYPSSTRDACTAAAVRKDSSVGLHTGYGLLERGSDRERARTRALPRSMTHTPHHTKHAPTMGFSSWEQAYFRCCPPLHCVETSIFTHVRLVYNRLQSCPRGDSGARACLVCVCVCQAGGRASRSRHTE